MHPNKNGRSKIISVVRTLEPTKKLLELINEFGRVPEYSINIQKSVVLFILAWIIWKTKENNSIYNSIKTINYLGINLTREMKDHYAEETDMKETEESTPKMEISPAHELEELKFLNVHTIQSQLKIWFMYMYG